MTQGTGRRAGLDEQAVLLAAGLADLAVSTLGTALGTVRGLLRRSDAAELAAEAEHDLVARGRLVLDRYASAPPAHLEVLARHALARRAAAAAPAWQAADDV
ncbi:polyprenyl synthetase [Streptomyces sp. NPDC008121]|uniref:polyprenyl synthetase n=1 Tax=Streptomyces sp. NPDC008121 TaxID=3364809 RepID=UPI0036ED3A97